MKINCKPGKYVESNFHDIRAITTLENIFAIHGKIASHLNKMDTGPNHDGFLGILDEDKVETNFITVQVKTLDKNRINKNKISYYLKKGKDDKFLAFCQMSRNTPTLFIGVDIEKSIAYWKKIDADYVENKIEKRTIYLLKKDKISRKCDNYYKEWVDICKKDLAGSRQEKNEDRSKELNKAGKTFDEKIFPSRTLSEVKLKLQSLFVDHSLKYKYYYPFLDLLEPYNLGERGKKTREKVRELFDISEKDERDFLKKMKSEELIKIIGEFCFPINKKVAENLQNEMLNKSAIDLDTIINLFVLENE